MFNHLDEKVNPLVNLENAKTYTDDLTNQEELKEYIFKQESEIENATISIDLALREKSLLDKQHHSNNYVYCVIFRLFLTRRTYQFFTKPTHSRGSTGCIYSLRNNFISCRIY